MTNFPNAAPAQSNKRATLSEQRRHMPKLFLPQQYRIVKPHHFGKPELQSCSNDAHATATHSCHNRFDQAKRTSGLFERRQHPQHCESETYKSLNEPRSNRTETCACEASTATYAEKTSYIPLLTTC